jgi:hypothetical protein
MRSVTVAMPWTYGARTHTARARSNADDPALHIFLGAGALEVMRDEYDERIATWSSWEHVSRAAQGA